nr:piggyBac transposable element-derived protein 2-like isoform X4 [Cherax quadricarinatus]
METSSKNKSEEATGVSCSGLKRKKSSKLAYFESSDKFDTRFKCKTDRHLRPQNSMKIGQPMGVDVCDDANTYIDDDLIEVKDEPIKMEDCVDSGDYDKICNDSEDRKDVVTNLHHLDDASTDISREATNYSQINEKLFYGEPSDYKSKYVYVLEESDSDPEVDDPELLESSDEYLPPDVQVSSDEEEETPAKKRKVAKKKKGIMIEEFSDEEHIHDELALESNPHWTRIDIQNDPLPEYQHEQPLAVRCPYEYFTDFFTQDMIDNITYQTNLYAKQKNIHTTFATVSEEITRFIGILLFMGINSYPAIEDYWATAFRISHVAEVMGSKRFRLLRRTIHFNDNTQKKDNDRFHKIRPLYTALTNACLKVPATPKQSVDEVVVAFKGKTAGNLRQYIKTKPDKWGFKLFCRASEDGFIHDILMYQGTPTFDSHPIKLPQEETKLPISSKIVLVLATTVNQRNTSAIYADNFFSSLPLVKVLRDKYNCRYTGTIHDNRCGKPNLVPVKQMEKNNVPRGTSDFQTNDGILVVRWKDNKVVTLVTNDQGVNPVCVVERYNKGTKTKTQVHCPAVIKNYNAHMGGINKSNMLVHLHKTPMKSKRWYMQLFAYVLDLAVVNAWLLYCRDCKSLGTKCMPLKIFRNEISITARSKGQKFGRSSIRTTTRASTSNSNGGSNDLPTLQLPVAMQYQRAARPDDSVRFDITLGHWPVLGKVRTCKYCSNKNNYTTSSFYCSVCKVNLCIKKDKNCFIHFHSSN